MDFWKVIHKGLDLIKKINENQPNGFSSKSRLLIDELVDVDEERVKIEKIQDTWFVLDTETGECKYYITKASSMFGQFCIKMQEMSAKECVKNGHQSIACDVHSLILDEISSEDDEEYSSESSESESIEVSDNELVIGMRRDKTKKRVHINSAIPQYNNNNTLSFEVGVNVLGSTGYLKITSVLMMSMYLRCNSIDEESVNILSVIKDSYGFGFDSNKTVSEFINQYRDRVESEKSILELQKTLNRNSFELVRLLKGNVSNEIEKNRLITTIQECYIEIERLNGIK
jgi:hypothetical protein